MKSTKNESLFFGDIEVFIDLYSLYPIIFIESGYFIPQGIWQNITTIQFKLILFYFRITSNANYA